MNELIKTPASPKAKTARQSRVDKMRKGSREINRQHGITCAEQAPFEDFPVVQPIK